MTIESLHTNHASKVKFSLCLIGLHWTVVRKMGILGTTSNYQNCIKSTNNKIPEYAREYKKEYFFIRGLNKEFVYFINKLDKLNDGLFESPIANRIKYNMKRFLRGQEKGKLKDISDFVIYEDDVVFNLNKIKNKLNNIDQYLDFILNCYHEEDLIFINPYPGFIDFYYYFNLFFTKLNIKYEYDSDSDSDDF